MEYGQIVESGTHDELLAARGPLLAAVPRLGRAGRGVSGVAGWSGRERGGAERRDHRAALAVTPVKALRLQLVDRDRARARRGARQPALLRDRRARPDAQRQDSSASCRRWSPNSTPTPASSALRFPDGSEVSRAGRPRRAAARSASSRTPCGARDAATGRGRRRCRSSSAGPCGWSSPSAASTAGARARSR